MSLPTCSAFRTRLCATRNGKKPPYFGGCVDGNFSVTVEAGFAGAADKAGGTTRLHAALAAAVRV